MRKILLINKGSKVQILLFLLICITRCSYAFATNKIVLPTKNSPTFNRAQKIRNKFSKDTPSLTVKNDVTSMQNLQTSNNIALKATASASESVPEPKTTVISQLFQFLSRNSFVVGMIIAVSLAKIAPMWGADGGFLRAEKLIGQYGVAAIFLISGLSLSPAELGAAVSRHRLNFLTQFASFVAWPVLVGLPLKRVLVEGLGSASPLPPPLAEGLLVLSTLPTTVNMCVSLTLQSGGNVASALCNAVLGNLMGVFVTPALLYRFFGANIALPFGQMIAKLCGKVLLPVTIGQLLRGTPVKKFYESQKKLFKSLQEAILIGIVWNAFCNTFSKGVGISTTSTFTLLALVPTLHLLSLGALFVAFRSPILGFTRRETVAATFCASHKTLAFGLPLVKTIFEGHDNLAAYCAPIMFIHPVQLLIGSLLAPKFNAYIEAGEEEEK